MAQMTQKTNQFNLTTKRYTESQIESFINDPNTDVYAMQVSDKFGDSGITGLAIIKNFEAFSEVDSFLMSCRIIGRTIERSFADYIIKSVHNKEIKAFYIKTKKNEQTAEFYESLGFQTLKFSEFSKEYVLKTNDYKPNTNNYIEIIKK
jgi:FkbH-like protein